MSKPNPPKAKPGPDPLDEPVPGTPLSAREWARRIRLILDKQRTDWEYVGAKLAFTSRCLPPWAHWTPFFKERFLEKLRELWASQGLLEECLLVLGHCSFIGQYEENRLIKAISELYGRVAYSELHSELLDLAKKDILDALRKKDDNGKASASRDAAGLAGAPLVPDDLPRQPS